MLGFKGNYQLNQFFKVVALGECMNMLNIARNEFPAKLDDEAKAKIEAIEMVKADHEDKIMKFFKENHTSKDDLKSVSDFDEDVEWKRQQAAEKAAEWQRQRERDAEADGTQLRD